jgi:hypothetical protein
MPSPQLAPDDADYPHGTYHGYRMGCRSASPCPSNPTCATVGLKRRKQTWLRRQGALPPAPLDRFPREPVLQHLNELLEIPGVTQELLSKIVGSPHSVVSHIIQRATYVSYDVSTRLLAITPEQARASVPRRPITDKIVQLIRSMQAQGFTAAWQADKLGCSESFLIKVCNRKRDTVSREFAEALAALAASVEAKRGDSAEVAGRARAQGWHPLMAYDEQGQLIPEAIRTGEDDDARTRRENRHRLAMNRIVVLERSLIFGDGSQTIAQDLRMDDRQVNRYREEAGLMFESNGRNSGAVKPECAARAQELRKALAEFRSVEPAMDPFELLRSLGMMTSRRFNIDPGDNLLPQGRNMSRRSARKKKARLERLGDRTVEAVLLGDFDLQTEPAA